MAIQIPCSRCGEYKLHKSRTRSQFEKYIKTLTYYRTYRCHSCNWRGWVSKRKVMGEAPILQVVLITLGWVLLALVLGVLLATAITK